MVSILLVGLGGFIGAAGRYAINRCKFTKTAGNFPLATFIVNTLGSLVLGLLYGLNSSYHLINKNVLLFFSAGITGAFTTFSTFSLESFQLIKNGHLWLFMFYLLASIWAGLLCAVAGFWLGKCFV